MTNENSYASQDDPGLSEVISSATENFLAEKTVPITVQESTHKSRRTQNVDKSKRKRLSSFRPEDFRDYEHEVRKERNIIRSRLLKELADTASQVYVDFMFTQESNKTKLSFTYRTNEGQFPVTGKMNLDWEEYTRQADIKFASIAIKKQVLQALGELVAIPEESQNSTRAFLDQAGGGSLHIRINNISAETMQALAKSIRAQKQS